MIDAWFGKFKVSIYLYIYIYIYIYINNFLIII